MDVKVVISPVLTPRKGPCCPLTGKGYNTRIPLFPRITFSTNCLLMHSSKSKQGDIDLGTGRVFWRWFKVGNGRHETRKRKTNKEYVSFYGGKLVFKTNEAPQRNHVEHISETSHHRSEKMGHLSIDFHFLLVKDNPHGY